MYKVIKAISVNQNLDSYWNLFQCEDTNDIDLRIDINSSVFEYGGIEVFSRMEYPLVFRSENALVSANSDWSKANITLLDGKDDGLEGALSAIIMTHLSIRNGLLLHASLVEYQGKGIGTTLLELCSNSNQNNIIYEAWGDNGKYANSKFILERCGYVLLKDLGKNYYKEHHYCTKCVNRNKECNECIAQIWIKYK